MLKGEKKYGNEKIKARRRVVSLLLIASIITTGMPTMSVLAFGGSEPDIGWYTVNPSAAELVITTANQLPGLASIVNNAPDDTAEMYDNPGLEFSDDFADKTINLGRDIDLVSYGAD
ncbi:hypothetical protein FACS1894132_02330 [Clostridia bacterium]|nr:hypothetical protein FACS1894132_02330 [Clostridia bacterium]